MVRGLRLVERGPALRQWLKMLSGGSRALCARAAAGYVGHIETRRPRQCLPRASPCHRSQDYGGAVSQQQRAVHSEVSRVLEAEGEGSLQELKALAEPHRLSQMGAPEVATWLKKWAAVYPKPSPYFVKNAPAEVIRVAEHAIELLGAQVVKGSIDPQILVSIAFHFSEPLYRFHESEASTLVARRLMEVVIEHTREVGLRRFSASQLGQLMSAFGSLRHRDASFLEEVRDECLRRGLQTFRARSLGELMCGFGRTVGFEPGKEFRDACVERSTKKGFLSRDCTPADVASLLWGYKKMRCTPSTKVLEDVAVLCCKADIMASLHVRELAFIVLSLTSPHHGHVPEAAACSLFDEIRRRRTSDVQAGFNFSLIEELLYAAQHPSFSPQAVEQSLRPFVQAVCADVARLGPAVYSSGALFKLMLASETIGVPEAEREFLVGMYLEQLPLQGVQGGSTRALCSYANQGAALIPGTAMKLMDAMVKEAFSRDDMRVDSLRRLLDAMVILRNSHGYAFPPDLSSHVQRTLAEATLDETRMDASSKSLSRLIYLLGSLRLCVDGDVMERLVGTLVDQGLDRLPSWHRSLKLRDLGYQATIVDGAESYRALELRLRRSIWAMWAQCFATWKEQGEGASTETQQTPSPAEMIEEFMAPESVQRGELMRLLHGLLQTPMADLHAMPVLVSVAKECLARDVLSMLPLDSLHGLLLGLLEVGRHHKVEPALIAALTKQVQSSHTPGYRSSARLMVDLAKAHTVFRVTPDQDMRRLILDGVIEHEVLRGAPPGVLRAFMQFLNVTGNRDDVPEPVRAAMIEALQNLDPRSIAPTLLFAIMEPLAWLGIYPGDAYLQQATSVFADHIADVSPQQLYRFLRQLHWFNVKVSEAQRFQLATLCSAMDPAAFKADEAGRLLLYLAGLQVVVPSSLVEALAARAAPLVEASPFKRLQSMVGAAFALGWKPEGPLLTALQRRFKTNEELATVSRKLVWQAYQ